MSSLKTNIEELKARIAVLVVATHSNGAHDIALDAFENVKNIEQKIAKVEFYLPGSLRPYRRCKREIGKHPVQRHRGGKCTRTLKS